MGQAPGSGQKRESALATVIEALPDALFRVRFEDGAELLAYLSGRMRLHRIRVLIGDRVLAEKGQYGGKGRIIKRL